MANPVTGYARSPYEHVPCDDPIGHAAQEYYRDARTAMSGALCGEPVVAKNLFRMDSVGVWKVGRGERSGTERSIRR